MLQFQVAGEVARMSIDEATHWTPSSVRRLLGAGVGAFGELVSEATTNRPSGAALDDNIRTPAWVSELGDPIWSGSVKASFEHVKAIAAADRSSVDGAIPVLVGGDRTTITGNLDLFDDHIVLRPHVPWQRRGIPVVVVHTDQPIQVSGMVEGDGGTRALVITLSESRTVVVLRLGLMTGKLGDVIAARLV